MEGEEPDAEDVSFARNFFSQFAAVQKQLDGDDTYSNRFASENAILVLRKHSKKRDRARDASVVAERKARKKRVKALAKKMSHRALKEDGMYDLQLGQRTYTDFLFMNQLWEQYMG